MNGRVQLGASEHSKDKSQLERNVRQADEDTETQSAAEILTNTLTEINEIKPILMAYVKCSKNKYNQTNCTLKPGLKGEPGDTGPSGIQGLPGLSGPMGPTGKRGD